MRCWTTEDIPFNIIDEFNSFIGRNGFTIYFNIAIKSTGFVDRKDFLEYWFYARPNADPREVLKEAFSWENEPGFTKWCWLHTQWWKHLAEKLKGLGDDIEDLE